MATAKTMKRIMVALFSAALMLAGGTAMAAPGQHSQSSGSMMGHHKSASHSGTKELKQALQQVKKTRAAQKGNQQAQQAVQKLRVSVMQAEQKAHGHGSHQKIAQLKQAEQKVQKAYQKMEKAKGSSWKHARDSFASAFDDAIGKLKNVNS